MAIRTAMVSSYKLLSTFGVGNPIYRVKNTKKNGSGGSGGPKAGRGS